MSDIEKIKTKLEARLRELDERAHDIDDELSETPDDNWSEHAVEAENDEVLEGIGNMAINEIQKIKVTLSKIEDGTYGICQTCEKKINPKRLEALPHAFTCIDCAPR